MLATVGFETVQVPRLEMIQTWPLLNHAWPHIVPYDPAWIRLISGWMISGWIWIQESESLVTVIEPVPVPVGSAEIFALTAALPGEIAETSPLEPATSDTVATSGAVEDQVAMP